MSPTSTSRLSKANHNSLFTVSFPSIQLSLVHFLTMAPSSKSILISLAMVLSAVQVARARPQASVAGIDTTGINSAALDSYTHVPVAPVHIAAETSFLPINNVLPIVNVLPTNVNDLSGMGPFDMPLLGGALGGALAGTPAGIPGAGLVGGFPGAGLGAMLGAGVAGIPGSGVPGAGLAGIPGAGLGGMLGAGPGLLPGDILQGPAMDVLLGALGDPMLGDPVDPAAGPLGGLDLGALAGTGIVSPMGGLPGGLAGALGGPGDLAGALGAF